MRINGTQSRCDIHSAPVRKGPHRLKTGKKPRSCARGLFNEMCFAIVVAGELFLLVAATQRWAGMSVGKDSLKCQKVLHLARAFEVAHTIFRELQEKKKKKANVNDALVNSRLCPVRSQFHPPPAPIKAPACMKHAMGHTSVTNVPHFLLISSGT